MEQFIPIGRSVLIKPDNPPTKTERGLIIPDNAQHRPSRGSVVKVGELVSGITPGDRVIYFRQREMVVTIGWEDLVIITIHDPITPFPGKEGIIYII